jgi:hypothetical protein
VVVANPSGLRPATGGNRGLRLSVGGRHEQIIKHLFE